MTGRVEVAKKWISEGYKASLVLSFVGLAPSTYYENINRQNKEQKEKEEIEDDKSNHHGRPVPGYSFTYDGRKISDEEIKECLSELICSDGYPYGYRKLTMSLKRDYNIAVNHKKVYRLCDEMGILRPQRVIVSRHPKHLAKMDTVNAPNQLWEMDIKYGYIAGEDRFFFQLSIIDVYDRSIIDYYVGLSCTAKDACRVLKSALAARGLNDCTSLPKIRTDNGPQFVSKLFNDTVEELGIIHERIPVKTPNMNAHIESFHSILEYECYSRYEFESFKEVYGVINEYMRYYNERRIHGSIKYMAPNKFYEAFMSNGVKIQEFSA
ncbi:MAG: putative transposase [Clostridiales bacterium]|nr:putative transposase [Clostridiales bacterium]